MHTRHSPKRAWSKLGFAVVVALVVLGVGAVAVLAGDKDDFAIAPSPSSQTVTQGQSAVYTMTVTRVNHFTGAVTLTASQLPSGASASWKLPDGTSSNVVPANQNSATLTITTTSGAQTGTAQPLITAVSGKLTHTTNVTLVVQPAAQPNFALSASPSSQTVVQTEQTSYDLSITRMNGFAGAVALSVSGTPKKGTVSFTPGATVSGIPPPCRCRPRRTPRTTSTA